MWAVKHSTIEDSYHSKKHFLQLRGLQNRDLHKRLNIDFCVPIKKTVSILRTVYMKKEMTESLSKLLVNIISNNQIQTKVYILVHLLKNILTSTTFSQSKYFPQLLLLVWKTYFQNISPLSYILFVKQFLRQSKKCFV